jgi:putative hydroxymethylpyrimidine transport system substrate-binding protein
MPMRPLLHAARGPLLAALALLAAACGADSTEDGAGRLDPLTVQLDWTPNADHTGLLAAQSHGHYRRAGLEVELRQPSDVSDSLRLVAAGRADVGISYQPELVYAGRRDLPVVAVAALVPRALNSIIARGDTGVREPADLRGRRIGVDGSETTTAYVETVLARAGLDPEHDADIVNIGFTLTQSLRAGKVDAVAGAFANIEGVELARQGLQPVVFPVDRHGVPPYDELVLVAARDRLADDPGYRDAVRRFVAATVRATGWACAHRDAAAGVVRERLERTRPKTVDATVRATLKVLCPAAGEPYGRMSQRRWDRFATWMYEHGLVDERADGSSLMTNDLLPAASAAR